MCSFVIMFVSLCAGKSTEFRNACGATLFLRPTDRKLCTRCLVSKIYQQVSDRGLPECEWNNSFLCLMVVTDKINNIAAFP